MVDKIDAFLDLTITMQSGREGVSLSDIQNKYNVSRRTAERLRDAVFNRFPSQVECRTEGKTKKYYIPNNSLSNIISDFTAHDISTLETLKDLLVKNNLDFKVEQFSKIITKIKAFSKNKRGIEIDAQTLAEAQGFALRPGPKLNINHSFIKELSTAILSCKKVEITFKGKNGNNSTQTVHPYGFLYGTKHYLIAFSEYANDFRYYMLHRLNNVKTLDNYFENIEEFNLSKYIENSFGVYQEEPIEVEWLFDEKVAKDAKLYIFHPSQTIKENQDGTLTVKFKAGGKKEMDWHLYTWGNHVKVIKPENWYEIDK